MTHLILMKMKTKKSDLKDLALQMKFPIVSDEGLLLLIDLIKNNNFKSVLEIGSGVGYSAIMLEEYVDSITTVEKNIYLAKIAQIHFDNYSQGKITLINKDALSLKIDGQYDLIFIDAAKAQYQRFFNNFKDNLSSQGLIVCDNLNFHNLDIKKVSRNTKALIRKINDFKVFLKNNEDFTTTFTDVGDGMSISRRKT